MGYAFKRSSANKVRVQTDFGAQGRGVKSKWHAMPKVALLQCSAASLWFWRWPRLESLKNVSQHTLLVQTPGINGIGAFCALGSSSILFTGSVNYFTVISPDLRGLHLKIWNFIIQLTDFLNLCCIYILPTYISQTKLCCCLSFCLWNLYRELNYEYR